MVIVFLDGVLRVGRRETLGFEGRSKSRQPKALTGFIPLRVIYGWKKINIKAMKKVGSKICNAGQDSLGP